MYGMEAYAFTACAVTSLSKYFLLFLCNPQVHDKYWTLLFFNELVTKYTTSILILTRTMLKIVTRVRACEMVTCDEYGDNKATDQSRGCLLSVGCRSSVPQVVSGCPNNKSNMPEVPAGTGAPKLPSRKRGAGPGEQHDYFPKKACWGILTSQGR